jgi:hypothetical protein
MFYLLLRESVFVKLKLVVGWAEALHNYLRRCVRQSVDQTDGQPGAPSHVYSA